MSFNLVKNSFDSKKDAEYSNKTRQNTNERYCRFNQYYFTAGDKNQFMRHIEYSPLMGQSTIECDQNIFCTPSWLMKPNPLPWLKIFIQPLSSTQSLFMFIMGIRLTMV